MQSCELTSVRHQEDFDRFCYDQNLANKEVIRRVKSKLADERGRKDVDRIIENNKEGLQISEETFFKSKLFNK